MRQTFLFRFQSPSGNQFKAVFFAFGFLSMMLANPAIAQQRVTSTGIPPRTLSVTGRGMEAIPATIAQVQLGVEVQGKTATVVQQEVAQRSAAVVELLRSRNVEKLQTTGISLNPNYSYENNVQRLTGYIGTNTVSFRLDTQRAGSLLDEAVNVGATRINGISFIATDAAISAARQKALGEATQDAQKQADAVLKSLNLTAREVIGIQVNGAFAPPQPILLRGEFAKNSSAASTPVVGGEQQVEASVTLQISY